MPAGKLEYGEDPREAAIRELKEETGAVAGEFRSLGELYPSPGYCGEIIRMYLARDLTFGETHLDEDEFIDVKACELEELVQMIYDGKIEGSRTVSAIMTYKSLLTDGKL